MPFITTTCDIEHEWEERTKKSWWNPPGQPAEPEVLLRQVNPNTFQLMEGFRYELPERDSRGDEAYGWDVPAHALDLAPDADGLDNSTDLASVPPWLWWFIASHGRHTRVALLHDHLIDRPGITDQQSDRVFRIALGESDVPILRRWIMWTAVSLASTARRRGRWFVGLGYGVPLIAFFLSLFVWWLGRYEWWPLGWLSTAFEGGRWWPFEGVLWASSQGEPLWGRAWLLPLGIGVLGFAWGWRWLFGMIGVASIALPTILVWVSYVGVWLLDWGFTIGYRAYAKLRRLDLRIPSPNFGKPYRRQAGLF